MKDERLKGCKVIPVAVQRGGVSKTTTTFDLGYVLARRTYRVLLIDSDPQGSLGLFNGVDISNLEHGLHTIYETIRNKGDIKDEINKSIIRPTYFKPVRDDVNKRYVSKEIEFGYDLIPSSIDLADYDILLSRDPLGGFYTTTLIKQIENDYDFVLIDCMPGLSTLTYSALCAGYSAGALVPMLMEPVTIRGGENLINVTTQIQKILWDKGIIHKGILGILKSMYLPKRIVQRKMGSIVDHFFPIKVFEATIPNKASCDMAHSKGRCFAEYDPIAREAYESLADEIIETIVARQDETEPVFVDSFGEELLDKLFERGDK